MRKRLPERHQMASGSLALLYFHLGFHRGGRGAGLLGGWGLAGWGGGLAGWFRGGGGGGALPGAS